MLTNEGDRQKRSGITIYGELTMPEALVGPKLEVQPYAFCCAKPQSVLMLLAGLSTVTRDRSCPSLGSSGSSTFRFFPLGTTKMYNIMMAREYARRLTGQGVDCFACQPGELDKMAHALIAACWSATCRPCCL